MQEHLKMTLSHIKRFHHRRVQKPIMFILGLANPLAGRMAVQVHQERKTFGQQFINFLDIRIGEFLPLPGFDNSAAVEFKGRPEAFPDASLRVGLIKRNAPPIYFALL
ncbi:MAG: hypothetical protein H6577_22655 [Lewinellaceae bacterium]|nr:hypothetical protein [Lewinellaceae bacterium]